MLREHICLFAACVSVDCSQGVADDVKSYNDGCVRCTGISAKLFDENKPTM